MVKQHIVTPLVINRSPWASLFLLYLLVVSGAILGQLVASTIYSLASNTDGTIHTTLGTRQSLLMAQATAASGAFIFAPLLYLCVFVRHSIRGLFQWQHTYILPILYTLGLTLTSMVANIWFMQWNMKLKLPNWLQAFEIWAQQKEAALQDITTLLTSFHSLAALGAGILVMGVIPAIGEELLFRGLIQPIFHRLTNNIHLAIGISAFFFSAIHLQFYGFVPRFLLGALFGYIYWWTKDLAFPIIAHFFNNTLTLLLLFLRQHGVITQDISAPQVPPGPVLLLFTALATILVNLLRQHAKHID